MADYDLGEAFKAIEEELIASMIRNMDHHRAEETKEGIQWSQWQVEQLNALEEYRRENREKFNPRFRDINAQIPDLIDMARQQGGMDQEASILEAMKQGLRTRKTSDAVMGEFFTVNDRKLNALVNATQNDFSKAEHAVLRMANDKYRKAIFNAQVYANAGGTTYEKAVDMATRDMLRAGLNCVEYKNGARHTLSDYADMCLKTATKRAYLTGEGEKRKEWGIATVIMNKRGNPCPLCAPWCGKVLIDDVWSGGKPDGKHPLMSTAIEKGLYHPRCKDVHTTYFPGISTADDPYDRKEREDLVEDYNQEQKQSYYERQAEQCERLSKYSLDPDNKRMYEERSKHWKKVCEEKLKGKNVANNDESDIIKSITIDNIENAVTGSSVKKEVADEIARIIEKHGSLRIFDKVRTARVEDKSIFNTVPEKIGTFFDVVLEFNEKNIGGMSIAEIDKMFEKADNTVANSLEDAIVHEIYHAKLINGLNYAQLKNLYDVLDEIHVADFSKEANKSGAECISEVGVLIERGEMGKIPKEAMDLFKKYME